jgi:hypothetical protein
VTKLAGALALLLACACRTTTEQHAAGSGPGALAVARAQPAAAWRVVERGATRGYVVRFSSDVDPAEGFFSVRNAAQQELGLIDRDGRAYRFRPHASEPDWLGTGTVAAGAARILGLAADAVLEEVELAALRPAGASVR